MEKVHDFRSHRAHPRRHRRRRRRGRPATHRARRGGPRAAPQSGQAVRLQQGSPRELAPGRRHVGRRRRCSGGGRLSHRACREPARLSQLARTGAADAGQRHRRGARQPRPDCSARHGVQFRAGRLSCPQRDLAAESPHREGAHTGRDGAAASCSGVGRRERADRARRRFLRTPGRQQLVFARAGEAGQAGSPIPAGQASAINGPICPT